MIKKVSLNGVYGPQWVSLVPARKKNRGLLEEGQPWSLQLCVDNIFLIFGRESGPRTSINTNMLGNHSSISQDESTLPVRTR